MFKIRKQYNYGFHKRKTYGFTILEIIIVIAVIAILAAVLVPTFSKIIGNTQDRVDKTNADTIYKEYILQTPKEKIKEELIIKVGDNRYIVYINAKQSKKIYDIEHAKEKLGLDPYTPLDIVDGFENILITSSEKLIKVKSLNQLYDGARIKIFYKDEEKVYVMSDPVAEDVICANDTLNREEIKLDPYLVKVLKKNTKDDSWHIIFENNNTCLKCRNVNEHYLISSETLDEKCQWVFKEINGNIEITNKNDLESLRYIRYEHGNGEGIFVYTSDGYSPTIYLYNN